MSAIEARRLAFAALLECYHNDFAEVKEGAVKHSREFIRQVLEAGKKEALTTDPRLTSTLNGAVAVGIAKQVMTNEVCSRAFIDIELGESAYIVSFDKRVKPDQIMECLRGMGAVSAICRPGDKLAEGIVSDLNIMAVEPVQMVTEGILNTVKDHLKAGWKALTTRKLHVVRVQGSGGKLHAGIEKAAEAHDGQRYHATKPGHEQHATDKRSEESEGEGRFAFHNPTDAKNFEDHVKSHGHKVVGRESHAVKGSEHHLGSGGAGKSRTTPAPKGGSGASMGKAMAKVISQAARGGAKVRLGEDADQPKKELEKMVNDVPQSKTVKLNLTKPGTGMSNVNEAEGRFRKTHEFVTSDGKHAFRAGKNLDYGTWDDRHYAKTDGGSWKHVQDHGYDGHASADDAADSAKAHADRYDAHIKAGGDAHKFFESTGTVVDESIPEQPAPADIGPAMKIEEDALDATKVTVHTDLDHPRVHTLFSIAKKHGAKVVHSDMDGKVKLHFPTAEHGKAFSKEADDSHGHMATIKLGERMVSKPLALTGSHVKWHDAHYLPDIMGGKKPAVDPKRLSDAARKHGAQLKLTMSGEHEALFHGYTNLKGGKLQQFMRDAGINDQHRPKVGWIAENVTESHKLHRALAATLDAAGFDGNKRFDAPAQGWNTLHAALAKHGLVLSDNEIHMDGGEHYRGAHQLAFKAEKPNEPPKLIDGAYLAVHRTSGVGNGEGYDQSDMPMRGRHEFLAYITGKKITDPAAADSSVPLKEAKEVYAYAYGIPLDESRQTDILKGLLKTFKRSKVQTETGTGHKGFDATFKAIMARQEKNRILAESALDEVAVALVESFGEQIPQVAQLTLLDNGTEVSEAVVNGLTESQKSNDPAFAETVRGIARVLCLAEGYATDEKVVAALDTLVA